MDRLASVLLRRTGRIHVGAGGAPPDRFIDHLDIDLAERGCVLDVAARAAVSALPEPLRTAWAGWLLATIDADLGADRPHVPLFRRFPDTTPESTERMYIERVLAFMFQEPEQPCVLCDGDRSVGAVSPCGHLVCRSCFDGADYSACPICHRRIDTDDPFLRVTRPDWRPAPATPLRMRRIVGRSDKHADATELRDALVTRATALAQADREDLAVLVAATASPGDLSWLPAELPMRETRAVAVAIALRSDLAVALPQATAHWTTATDIARTLWALSGGDPGLVLPAKQNAAHGSERWRPAQEARVEAQTCVVAPLSRPLRRAVLAAFDALDLRNAVEDVLRHPTVWKRLGERLHPFENAGQHPHAAVCFAVLRRSAHATTSAVGRAILAADEAQSVEARVTGDLVRAHARTFASLVEARLAMKDAGGAARLLSTRPGEFLRRLDQLAGLTPPDGLDSLATAAGNAAESAAASVALSAYAALAARDKPPPAAAIPAAAAAAVSRDLAVTGRADRIARLRARFVSGRRIPEPPAAAHDRLPREQGRVPGTPRRVFFPRGNILRAWSEVDRRPLLAAGSPDAIRAAITESLVMRAGRLPRFDVAIVDAALADYPAPTRGRIVAPASRTITRGARVPIPAGDTLRLFLHWTEPNERTRVDLDLSVLFLDDCWQYVGHCDYTALRFRDGAVHSGDLTSAPPPLGATEFLDLRFAELANAGVAYAVPIVFSYNDVPFEALTDAIAGFSMPTAGGQVFDAGRVALRFDLVGAARVLVPMIVHLSDRTLRWADLNLSSAGYGHSVSRYAGVLGFAAEDMELAFGTNRRATFLDIAAIHAAARAERVWVRFPDGTTCESAPSFSGILEIAGHGSGAEDLPPVDNSAVLFVAAEQLPAQVAGAGAGSVLLTATTGDAAANADAGDLLTDL